MATYTEAEYAIIRRIQQIPDRPGIVYPNDGQKVPRPRWLVQVSSQTGTPTGVSGTTRATTEVVVQVEVDEGSGDSGGASKQALIDAFPVGLRFDGLTVEQAPEPRAPLTGDGYHATPVIIRARHFF